MKKIRKNSEAESIFKKFLQDKDIINQAENLFNNIDKNKFAGIIQSAKKENIEIKDLFLGAKVVVSRQVEVEKMVLCMYYLIKKA